MRIQNKGQVGRLHLGRGVCLHSMAKKENMDIWKANLKITHKRVEIFAAFLWLAAKKKKKMNKLLPILFLKLVSKTVQNCPYFANWMILEEK